MRHPASFARSIPSTRYVPFSPFLTTSTVCSAKSFAGLLHPAASYGVRPVSESSVRLSPMVSKTIRVTNQCKSKLALFHHSPVILTCVRRLQTTLTANQVSIRCSSPRAHPPFEVFPSDLAVPPSPPQLCVSTPLDATVWPTPLAVARCVLPPSSITIVADSEIPQPLVHLAQPQGFEPSPSPLHPQAVSDLSMPATPLGFSNVGSPTFWQCAFESD